jgi:phosphomannomutase
MRDGDFLVDGDFIVRSVVTGTIGDKIAKDFGVDVHKTLTGFK